jgi:hypothetical protein
MLADELRMDDGNPEAIPGQKAASWSFNRWVLRKRACIDWSGHLPGGLLVGIDSSVSVELLRAGSRTEPK